MKNSTGRKSNEKGSKVIKEHERDVKNFVTTSSDRSVTKVVDVNETFKLGERSFFHNDTAVSAYPSLEDDRMMYQLYYGNDNNKTLSNISILAVVSPSWPWHEKEFSSKFDYFLTKSLPISSRRIW